jgi:hypothetical protein
MVHVGAEADHVDCMQSPAVGVKKSHDVQCHYLRVEGLGILEVVVSHLLDGFAEEFGNTLLGCLVTGIVIKAGLVGRFRSDANNGRGVFFDFQVIEVLRIGQTNLALPWASSYLAGLVRIAMREWMPPRRS